MTNTRAVLVATVCCLGACGRTGPEAAYRTQVDTVGATIVVRNVPLSPEAPALLSRIGSSDGGPAEFGRVTSVTMNRDGVVYVADALANEVRMFASNGRYLTAFGGRGEGPGEFGDLYSLGWLADTLAALDPGNARISLHSAEGTYAGQRPWLPYSGPSRVIRLVSFEPDALYAPYPWFDQDNPKHAFLRFEAGRAVPDTVLFPRRQDAPSGSLCRLPGGGISFFANPYAPAELVVPGPGRTVVSARTDEPRVLFWSRPEDSTRVVEVRESSSSIPEVAWEALIAEYSAYRAGYPGADCEPDGLSRPESMPRISGVFFTSTGSLVIERVTDVGTRFDFFSQAGVLEQRVELPARDPDVPPVFVDQWILVVLKDSLDVQGVALYER